MRFHDGSRHGTGRRGDVDRRHDLVPSLEVDNLVHNLADSSVRNPEEAVDNLVRRRDRVARGCEVARRDHGLESVPHKCRLIPVGTKNPRKIDNLLQQNVLRMPVQTW